MDNNYNYTHASYKKTLPGFMLTIEERDVMKREQSGSLTVISGCSAEWVNTLEGGYFHQRVQIGDVMCFPTAMKIGGRGFKATPADYAVLGMRSKQPVKGGKISVDVMLGTVSTATCAVVDGDVAVVPLDVTP
jgi:hypothetical protein